MPTINQTKFETMAQAALAPLLAECAITGFPPPTWLVTGYKSVAQPAVAPPTTAAIRVQAAPPPTRRRARTARARSNGAAAGGQGKISVENVLKVIADQPHGISDANLKGVLLDTYGAKPAVVGTYLSRMKVATKSRPALITQRGDLWVVKAAAPRARTPATARKASSVDKSMNQRRRTREAKGNAAGAPAEGQPQAAAAT